MTDINAWLTELGLDAYAQRFAENHIDFTVIRELTDQDLEKLGVDSLGHRRKLLRAIAEIGKDKTPKVDAFAAAETRDTAERRQITVIFCDLVGSTALSVRHDPEDLRAIIDEYHRCCAAEITRFGGWVAQYLGDGVVAYFGYPQAHEDDAERTVRAGLALIEALVGLSTPERLRVRIGIATGLVVTGERGDLGTTRELGVFGETPNLAARLQSLATSDSIVIDANTRRLLGRLFEYRELGPVEVKGFDMPLAAYEVLRPSIVQSRFEALHDGRLTPLVGREEEIELVLRRWAQAKNGGGRVVLLSGEPGIGKSRIIAAIRERLEGDYTFLRYFCSPHTQDSALRPAIAQLERAAGFEPGD